MLTLPVCEVDFAQLSSPHCQVCKEPSLKFERAIQSGKERERRKRGGRGGEPRQPVKKEKMRGSLSFGQTRRILALDSPEFFKFMGRLNFI
jgi:hypothetical protein